MSSPAPIAFLFAGQGAQAVGMGKDLYDAYPAARELFDRADAAVPFDLKTICFEGPEEDLRRTDVSQPAIVTCSLAALAALEAELGGALPAVTCAAGLSLGEYRAGLRRRPRAGGLPGARDRARPACRSAARPSRPE